MEVGTFRGALVAGAKQACVILVQVVIVGLGVVWIARLGIAVYLDIANLRQNALAGAAAAQYLEAAVKAGVLPSATALAQEREKKPEK